MKLKQFKKELHKNPEFKKEYERFDLLFEIRMLLLEFKILVGIFIKRIKGKMKDKLVIVLAIIVTAILVSIPLFNLVGIRLKDLL